MSFANFSTIQQTSLNSCGAFALAAAMDNFGLALQKQTAKLLNTVDLAQGFNQADTVIDVGTPADFAGSIYQVTGNLLIDFIAMEATYQYTNPVSDMNSTSTIAYVANLFGFTTTVFYDATGQTTFSFVQVPNVTGQGNLFATEVAIMGTVPITITASLAGYSTLPAQNQVHILLVNNNHWVAINDKQLYDPGTGYVGAYTVNAPLPLATITYPYGGGIKDYPFSGIWIQLQHQ